MNRKAIPALLATILMVLSGLVVLSTVSAPPASANAVIPTGDLTLAVCGTPSPCGTGSITVNPYSAFIVIISSSGTTQPTTVTDSLSVTLNLQRAVTSVGIGGEWIYAAANVSSVSTSATVTATWATVGVSYDVWFADVAVVTTASIDSVGTGTIGGTSTNESTTVPVTGTEDYVVLAVVSAAPGASQSFTATSGQGVRNHNDIVSNQLYFATVTSAPKTSYVSYPTWVNTSATPTGWIAVAISFSGSVNPAAPTGLTVTGTTVSSVGLSWTKPPGPVLNSTVLQAVWAGSCGSWSAWYNVPSGNSYTVTGISAGYALCFAVESWNTTSYPSHASIPVSDVHSSTGSLINIYGNTVVTTPLVFANDSVTVWAGNITVSGSGCLTVDNSSLMFAQNQTGNHVKVSLLHGLLVNSASACLVIKYSTVGSLNGSTSAATDYQGWVDDNSALNVTIFHSTFKFLGEVNGTAAAGNIGLELKTHNVGLAYDSFYYTYQVLFSGTSATGDSVSHTSDTDGSGYKFAVSNPTILNSINDTPAMIQCTVGCAHFTVSNTTINATMRFAIPLYSSGNYVRFVYNHVFGNVSVNNFHGIEFVGVGQNASSYLTVSHNDVQGGEIYLNPHGRNQGVNTVWDNITGNTINNDGYGEAILVTGTNNANGTLNEQLQHLEVENNTITNYTVGVRLASNVSFFNVSGNVIEHSINPATNAYVVGVYLIRGVNNGTVYGNTMDTWDYAKTPGTPFYANPIDLESRVRNVNVSFNVVYNFTQAGITDQGSPHNYTIKAGNTSFGVWLKGSDGPNQFYSNSLTDPVSLATTGISTRKITCFLSWDWANFSVFRDNVCTQKYATAAQGHYSQAGVYISSFGNQFIGNTFVNTRFGVVVSQTAANQEWNGIGVFNASYNDFIGNTFTNTTFGTYTIDNVANWSGVTDVVSGAVPASWTFVVLNSTHGGRWLLSNAVYNYSVTSSDNIYATKVYSVGTATIVAPALTYDANLADWKSSTPEILFGLFNATVSSNLTAGWYNQTMTFYGVGGVTWLASVPSTVTVSYTFTDTIIGNSYGFWVGAVLMGSQVATIHGVTFVWNGSTTVTPLSIGVAPPLPPPSGGAIVGLILTGVACILIVGGIFYVGNRFKRNGGSWGGDHP